MPEQVKWKHKNSHKFVFYPRTQPSDLIWRDFIYASWFRTGVVPGLLA
jgi:hypothetical protein